MSTRQYAYTGFNGRESLCDVTRLVGSDQRLWIILTERADNHGPSVTNSYETIATQLIRELGLAHNEVRWFEHYSAESYPATGHRLSHLPSLDEVTLTEVTLTWDERRHSYSPPKWRPAAPSDREHIRRNTTLRLSPQEKAQ